VAQDVGDTFSWHAPRAGAICWARYRGAIPALDVVEKLRAQHSVLLCPGDHFGTPGFLRLASAASCSISGGTGGNGNVDCVDCSVTD